MSEACGVAILDSKNCENISGGYLRIGDELRFSTSGEMLAILTAGYRWDVYRAVYTYPSGIVATADDLENVLKEYHNSIENRL